MQIFATVAEPATGIFPKAAESSAESGNSGRAGKGAYSHIRNRADSPVVAAIRAAICRRYIVSKKVRFKTSSLCPLLSTQKRTA